MFQFAQTAERQAIAECFASNRTDAEHMLAAADELEQVADMLASFRDGARLLRSQAREIRRLARKR